MQSLYSDPGDMGFTDLALSDGVLVAASATPAADAGASPVGDVYVFNRGKAGWVKKQILRASGIQSGAFWSVATDSKTIVAGAGDADGELGAAYVFEIAANGAWSRTAVLAPGDRTVQDSFGWSVAVDGDVIAVGVPGPVFHEPGMCGTGTLVPCVPGKVYLFQRTTPGWEANSELVSTTSSPGDQFGLNASLSAGVLVSQSQDDLFAYPIGNSCTTSGDCAGGTCTGGVCAQPAPCLPMADAGTGDAGPDAPLDASDAGSVEADQDATPDVADARSDAPGPDAAPEGGAGPARSLSASGGCGCRLARGREGLPWGDERAPSVPVVSPPQTVEFAGECGGIRRGGEWTGVERRGQRTPAPVKRSAQVLGWPGDVRSHHRRPRYAGRAALHSRHAADCATRARGARRVPGPRRAQAAVPRAGRR